jgi:broad specificity phosphatase PhoE
MTLYNDRRIFCAFHPEQYVLREREGAYWYRYPQGENVPDVRRRNHDWLGMLIRDFAGKKVLTVTHHLSILALRANLERWGADQFLEMDEKEKPINCGVTEYRGDPTKGANGHLVLKYYNRKLY